MKVLIAVHHFPPSFTGGAEWRAYRTATALRERGHDVCVICVERIDTGPDRGAAGKETFYKGIPVHRLSYNLHLAPDPVLWEYDNPWIGNYVREFLKEHRPDLVHLISGYLLGADALRAVYEAGLPIIVTLTDYWFICPRITLLRSNGQVCTDFASHCCVRCLAEEKRRYRWPARTFPELMDFLWDFLLTDKVRAPVSLVQIERRQRVLTEAFHQIDLALCPSNFLRRIYLRAGAPADRLILSRQGLALPGEIVPKTPSAALRIGYTGQLAEHKGVHLLIEAFKHLNHHTRPATLTIYGDPTRFPKYVRKLQKLADGCSSIRFAGTYSYGDLGRVLSELDVLVVPSLWYENSPNTILEAFAYHTPVIASDMGGMSELVEHGKSGLLFTPGDVKDLRRQLQRLVDEPELVRRMSAAVPPVRTLDDEIRELEGLYRKLL
ncbi:MAG: glycosyltransferase family 4 protein [Anaerolineae bacterium]|nr:glycosyltransferase family 4 protein [Anaerolineae bacterium]